MESFEIKGRSVPLPLLRFLGSDIYAFEAELRSWGEGLKTLRETPVLLDFSPLEGGVETFAVKALALLEGYGVVPMGIVAHSGQADGLRKTSLPVVVNGSARNITPGKPGAASGPLIVEQQVRSGRQVYARGRDLIVAASVSPGAEIGADGNIHVYGRLSGRALAGGQGNAEARIFCREFNAELVSIAGLYMTSEQLAPYRGTAVQIRSTGEQLLVEKI